MNLGTITKKTSDILFYTLDWSEWLPTGDTVASAVWTVPSGLTSVTTSTTSSTTLVKISGGTVGNLYTITCVMTTTTSTEAKTVTFIIRVIA